MMEWFMKFSTDTFMFNSIIGFVIYWIPLLVCTVGYIKKTGTEFAQDKIDRAKYESGEKSYYSPSVTLGDIIGRGLASIVPIVNLIACIFDVSPDLFRTFFKWIGRTFNQALVPVREDRVVKKESKTEE